MKRDNIIDNKINELTVLKASLEETLSTLPTFKTNLTVKTRTDVFNFRTCSTINDVFRGYMMLSAEWNAIDKFNAILASANIAETADPSFHGFTRAEWEDDIKNLCVKIDANARLAKVTAALKDLEKFYSGDRKEENAFNALLDSIDSI